MHGRNFARSYFLTVPTSRYFKVTILIRVWYCSTRNEKQRIKTGRLAFGQSLCTGGTFKNAEKRAPCDYIPRELALSILLIVSELTMAVKIAAVQERHIRIAS